MQRLTVDLEKNATELNSKVFNPSFSSACPGRSTGNSCRLGDGVVIKVFLHQQLHAEPSTNHLPPGGLFHFHDCHQQELLS